MRDYFMPNLVTRACNMKRIFVFRQILDESALISLAYIYIYRMHLLCPLSLSSAPQTVNSEWWGDPRSLLFSCRDYSLEFTLVLSHVFWHHFLCSPSSFKGNNFPPGVQLRSWSVDKRGVCTREWFVALPSLEKPLVQGVSVLVDL